MSLEVGRLCLKIAGRDAGLRCVIVDVMHDNFVMIDGETRRRKCNIEHLEPLAQKIQLHKGASHAQVAEALKQLGIETRMTTPKAARPQVKAQRPAAKPAPVKAVPKKASPVKAAVKAPVKQAAAAA